MVGSTKLSRVFCIILGTKARDLLSGIIFIIVIDCIFKPIISVALGSQNVQNGKMLNPLAVQDFADSIAMVMHDEVTLTDMITIAELSW